MNRILARPEQLEKHREIARERYRRAKELGATRDRKDSWSKWRNEHRERYKAYMKNYYAKHRDRLLEQDAERYAKKRREERARLSTAIGG